MVLEGLAGLLRQFRWGWGWVPRWFVQ